MSLVNNKDLRANTVAVLKANTTIGSSRIFGSKVTPHMMNTLPCVGVYITNSSAEGVNHDGVGFTKTVDVVIEVAVTQSSNTAYNYVDQLDDYIHQIKEALFRLSTWKSQFENVARYTESISLDEINGEQPIATASLIIQCEIVER